MSELRVGRGLGAGGERVGGGGGSLAMLRLPKDENQIHQHTGERSINC